MEHTNLLEKLNETELLHMLLYGNKNFTRFRKREDYLYLEETLFKETFFSSDVFKTLSDKVGYPTDTIHLILRELVNQHSLSNKTGENRYTAKIFSKNSMIMKYIFKEYSKFDICEKTTGMYFFSSEFYKEDFLHTDEFLDLSEDIKFVSDIESIEIFKILHHYMKRYDKIEKFLYDIGIEEYYATPNIRVDIKNSVFLSEAHALKDLEEKQNFLKAVHR